MSEMRHRRGTDDITMVQYPAVNPSVVHRVHNIT